MSESLQHKLDRVRRGQRVQITYSAEAAGAVVLVELRFVIGVLGDFSGNSTQPLKALQDRSFIPIDRDNFNHVMARLNPGLNLLLPSALTNDDRKLAVQLTLRSMADFEPAGVARQVEPLCQLLEARNALQQLAQGGAAPAEQKKLLEDRLAQLGLSKPAAAELGERPRPELIAAIDGILSRQLATILHHPAFQKLEGTWRGLHFLVHQSETDELLKIRVLNASKRDLIKDAEKAIEFDQSALFKKVYEEEYSHLGGQPYGLLVGDYEFGRSAEDISLLRMISNVAAAAHAPFVAAAAPKLFNFERFTELAAPRDLAKIFSTVEYASWKSFRESDDSRYVALTLPHVLARLPYGKDLRQVEEFDFEELVDGKDHDKYLWMSAAWAYAARVTDAFAKYGWMARTRGVEGGGKVEGLPVLTVPTDDGAMATKCPTEIAISDRREFELSRIGFLPLLYFQQRGVAVFARAQSCQKPRQYFSQGANSNSELSAKLNYILCVSRFVHYLKVMARDKLDSFPEVSDCERWLNEWIMNYVIANPETAGDEALAKLPLGEARVEFRAVQG
jgi:type VI secretion system protein ImpC